MEVDGLFSEINDIFEEGKKSQASTGRGGSWVPGDGFADLTITVPERHYEAIAKWLAHGEAKTNTGMGVGVLRRMGILNEDPVKGKK